MRGIFQLVVHIVFFTKVSIISTLITRLVWQCKSKFAGNFTSKVTFYPWTRTKQPVGRCVSIWPHVHRELGWVSKSSSLKKSFFGCRCQTMFDFVIAFLFVSPSVKGSDKCRLGYTTRQNHFEPHLAEKPEQPELIS